MEIFGDKTGIKTGQLDELKRLALLRTERPELIHTTLLEGVGTLSELWNREIALYINRSGIVTAISIGKHAAVKLPPLSARHAGRLRCIHTHPGGNFHLSSVDISAMRTLGLESMVSIGVKNQQITGAELALPTHLSFGDYIQITTAELATFDYNSVLSSGRPLRRPTAIGDKELTFLIGLEEREEGQELLEELGELVRTAGGQVVGQMLQSKRYGNSVSYLGKGKVDELLQKLQNSGANTLVGDDELTPVQVRTLEQATGLKVLDRTTLILDIFAQRAKSREGKLQVELAQMKHILPHLVGQGQNLSRLGGGIGTRGPGETKLEVDRRRVRQKISFLENQLDEIRQTRSTQRQQRSKSGLPLIALVGYTNAGKTTFLEKAMQIARTNDSRIQGEDKLFATLDPVVRKITVAPNRELLVSDTVGFIRKLPHQLLHAFLATLEEVQNADVLIHVLDASHPLALERADTVQHILNQLGCAEKPRITLLNKIDKVEFTSELNRLAQQLSHPIPISLKESKTLKIVWDTIDELLSVQEDKTN